MATSLNFRREGCSHYKRFCKIQAPCCGNIYSCRFCHDENENHELNRSNIKSVVCTNCSFIQPISQKCRKCNTFFGKYYCSICKLFDNEDKKQFHCKSCGICRVGGQQNYFHCKPCGLCLAVRLCGNHTCVENASRTTCPLCVEDLHTSINLLHVPACGHLLHQSCYDKLKEADVNSTCPICRVKF